MHTNVTIRSLIKNLRSLGLGSLDKSWTSFLIGLLIFNGFRVFAVFFRANLSSPRYCIQGLIYQGDWYWIILYFSPSTIRVKVTRLLSWTDYCQFIFHDSAHFFCLFVFSWNFSFLSLSICIFCNIYTAPLDERHHIFFLAYCMTFGSHLGFLLLGLITCRKER